MVKKIWKTVAGCFFLGWMITGAAAAAAQTGVKIMDAAAPDTVFIPLETMASHTTSITLVDPNFKEDGPARFSGISLNRIMAVSGLSIDKNITAIGSDQYMGFFPASRIARGNGILAWQVDDTPIPGFKGGPVKIVFPPESLVHGACYTWYVDILIAGTFDNPALTIRHGANKDLFDRNTLLDLSHALAPDLVSFPQGCRNEYPDQRPDKELRAVALAELLPDPALSRITLKTLAGKDIVLKADIFNYPAFLVVGTRNAALHPAFGGPFSLVFPVEQYPELADFVPESGAIFFLNEMVFE